MSFQKKFKKIQQNLQSVSDGSISSTINYLNSLSNTSKNQIVNNTTTISQQIKKILPSLLQNYQRAASNKSSQTSRYASALNLFANNYNSVMNPSMLNDIRLKVAQGLQTYNQRQIQLQQTKLQDRVLQNELQKAARKQGVFLKPQIYTIQSNQLRNKPYLSIQQQIMPIKGLLNVSLQKTNPNNIPLSVNLLNQYAVSQGYLPLGPITQNGGNAYIGRKIVKNGNNQYVFAYPKNTIKNISTPDIMSNFKYYANKTINSWNNYVQNEAKLVDFVKKNATSQLRKSYVQDRLSSMNKETFAGQLLATLTYYYVQIPMQIYIKYNYQNYNGSEQSFLKKYQPGNVVSKNPLLLSSAQAMKIYTLLMDKKYQEPTKVAKKIEDWILINCKNGVNNHKMSQVIRYRQNKQAQATQYFSNCGIPQTTSTITLTSPYMVGIKKRKMLLTPQLQNTQIVQLIQKVAQKQNKQDPKLQKLWNQSWQSEFLYSYDYIWNYDL